MLWRSVLAGEVGGYVEPHRGGMGLKRGGGLPRSFMSATPSISGGSSISAPYRLVLLSEMRVPGEAIFEFAVTP